VNHSRQRGWTIGAVGRGSEVVQRARHAGRLVLNFALAGALAMIVTLPAGAHAAPTTLRVFAAASLSEAFVEIGKAFETAHAGTAVQLNLAGSQQLAAQLAQGAPADVFASADERWMTRVREQSLVAGEPVTFASNRLTVIVPRANPRRIARLQDLAQRRLKLVVGAETVPVGRYTHEMLDGLARREGFGPDYALRVRENIVSREENVKAVAGKVRLGEADAGIVYGSDVTPALAEHVREIAIPDSVNVFASYPIAVLKSSRAPELARAFVAFMRSTAGQRILDQHGLMPANAGERAPAAVADSVGGNRDRP